MIADRMGNAARELNGIRILTTDPEKRIGLYAIRYLGRAGARVDSIAKYNSGSLPIGCTSIYLNKILYLRGNNYLQTLKAYFKEHSADYDLINPIDVAKMLCLLSADEERTLIGGFLLPKKESLIVADNKELLTRHAIEMGFRCPRTWFRVHPDSVAHISRSEISYPCIIKFRGDMRQTHWKPEERYSIVNSPDSFIAEYRRLHEIEEYPIVQEYIAGASFGYFALFDKKRSLKAQFCHKRIREYPITGGPSSCCESVFDQALVDIGRRLLDSLEWTGIAMVEFKYDTIRRKYFIIEVNPRYWGSLPLAVYSGVNFPVLQALSALGIDYPSVLDYRKGTKLRFLDKDVRSILQSVKLEKNYVSKLKLFIKIFDPTIKEGFIAFDDIKPLLHALRQRI